ncbi:MAG: nucleotidyltransferase family protein, partial [Gemmatimonadales bacterium]
MTSNQARSLLALLRLDGGPSRDEARAMWLALAGCPVLELLLRLEGATLWLYRRLHDLGVPTAPPLGAVLREAAHQQLMFGLRVDEETRAIAEILRDGGIRVVMIKGPARRLAAKLYPYADARSTSDVDLLVPERQDRGAWQLLVGRGYERATEPEPWQAGHFHLPPLWNRRRVAVELHTSTAPWLTPSEAWRRVLADRDMVSQDGV